MTIWRHLSWAFGLVALALAAPVANGGSAAAPAPVRVGTDKQLFIDDRFVETARGVRIVVNRPRVTGEKLLTRDKPWESNWLGGYQTVVQDADRIHLWYECTDHSVHKPDMGYVAYAFSTDGGATWTKPDVGVIEYEGSRANNLVMKNVHGAHVFRNRPDAPAAERYLMFAGNPNQGYASPDGFRWTPIGEKPFLDRTLNEHLTLDSQNVIFWDTRLRRYVAYPRFNVPTRTGTARINRRFGRAESATFGDFRRFAIVFERDERDPVDFDFYTTAAVQYPWAADAYFMFPAAYHHSPPPPNNDGPVDLQFAASRDGIRWLRPDRAPLIRRGADGSWSQGCLYAGYGLSRHGDEVSLYYKGNDVTHGAYRSRGYVGGIISRAIYRLDGFMSADAPYEGGEFTTPALVFDGNRLELNFDGSAGGWALVELLGGDGSPIPGFGGPDAARVTGNSVRRLVSWKGGTDLGFLRGKPVRLRFRMRDAKLYAFQFPGR